MKTLQRRPGGFTLIEVLVASAISLIAVSAASAALISQYRSMQSADMARGANTTNRNAIQELEHALRLAGWGVDPRFAFDFTTNCASTPCRDSKTAPDSLVFVARNPNYQYLTTGQSNSTLTCATSTGCYVGKAWEITASLATTPRTVTITNLPTGVFLERGRVVMATCALGANPVMLTLGASYTGAAAAVTLTPSTTATAPYNDPASLQTCHNQAGAALFLVDRYRYFVQTPTGSTSPWLMLDTGLDLDNDGTLPPTDADDLIPVAKNVEDMQVAYVLNTGTGTGPDSNGDWILGNDPSAAAEEPNASVSAPVYTTASDDALRFNLHPANVRAVRVSLVIRSDRPDRSHSASWTGDSIPYAENRAGTSASGGSYRRYTAETEITVRNLDSRMAFVY